MDENPNRPAREPGGVECNHCGAIFIGEPWHTLCAACVAPSGKVALRRWVRERLDNCQRIAATRSGKDRDGWLDDAAHFSAILTALAPSPPEPVAEEHARSARLKRLPVHVSEDGERTIHVRSDDFDWLLHKLAICPMDDFEQSDIAKIIRREMQDNSIPATERSERAAALILANLTGHPDDEPVAEDAGLVEEARPFAEIAFGRDSLPDDFEFPLYTGPREFGPGWNVKRAFLTMRQVRRLVAALSQPVAAGSHEGEDRP